MDQVCAEVPNDYKLSTAKENNETSVALEIVETRFRNKMRNYSISVFITYNSVPFSSAK